MGRSDLPVLEAGWTQGESSQGEGIWATRAWEMPPLGSVENTHPVSTLCCSPAGCWALCQAFYLN